MTSLEETLNFGSALVVNVNGMNHLYLELMKFHKCIYMYIMYCIVFISCFFARIEVKSQVKSNKIVLIQFTVVFVHVQCLRIR